MTPARVGVIGLGLIGGSIVKRLAASSSAPDPVGFDVDPRSAEAAEDAGVAIAGSVAELARSAELVVVAVPPEATAELVAEVLAADPAALVTDVASVKSAVLERALALSADARERFLPGHPLAGAESAGFHAGDAELLLDTVWAVCPPVRDAPAELLTAFAPLFDAFDARVIVCDATDHDVAVARTSHAPHIAAAVIAGSLAGDAPPLAAALSGGAFRDMTRVARSDPALWSEILGLNSGAVGAVLDGWMAALERLRAALADGDRDAVLESWSRGSAIAELVERLRWEEPRFEERAFEAPPWDELLELGRRGLSLRRLRADGGVLRAEVAASS